MSADPAAEVAEAAPPEPAPAAAPPTILCRYCTCEIHPRGLVGYDYNCGEHTCPTGGCVPQR